MPVMKPAVLERNLTPSSVELVSPSSAFCGVAVDGQIVQGHVRVEAVIVTVRPADGVSMFPLSSNARLLIVAEPTTIGVHWYVQLVVPVAWFQVVPPSVETSTP